MVIKKSSCTASDPITPKELYLNRRQFIKGAAAFAAAGAAGSVLLDAALAEGAGKLKIARRGRYTVPEKTAIYQDAVNYNNFYEFSTNKHEVAKVAADFKARPWTIAVDGHVKERRTFDIDELIALFPLEERIYRLRCVETWSMVIPWVGFPLADLIRKCDPTSRARYVQFTTLHDPERMPGQRRSVLPWPYVEGLRWDEAMHPLTILAVGMYGEVMPNQNGAPVRLVVPWKYGFKSIKSIVRITLTSGMPRTTWPAAKPGEYGFFANVNPDVEHPRWSQAEERRLGEFGRRKTLLFNGYAQQVAHLYKWLDLKKFF